MDTVTKKDYDSINFEKLKESCKTSMKRLSEVRLLSKIFFIHKLQEKLMSTEFMNKR